jgi:hypothetical protein
MFELAVAYLFEPAESGLTEYQSCSRMQADVIEGNPLCFDAVEPPVCPKATVTPKTGVFSKITTASVASVASLFHCDFIHVDGVSC